MQKLSLFLLILFLTSTTVAVEIDHIETFHNSYGHDETIMLGGEISDAEDVWYRAYVNDELVKTDQMRDSVGDGYYASPTGVVTEGDTTYEIEVTAYGYNDEEDSEIIVVKTDCRLRLLGECFF